VKRIAKCIWAFPTTCIGLLVGMVALITGGRWRVVDGVIEFSGGALAWLLFRCVPIQGGASAITLGHVVLGRDLQALDRTREHERIHVRQAERWGPLFVPAYLLAAMWQWLRGRDGYSDNPFERAARRE
jgi:hypothetical protein